MCKAALPRRISSSEATIILILNIFLPGFGTMFASIMGRACRCDTFFVGILQLITAPLIVGWIWSIWWGVAACGRVGHKREVDDAHSGKSRHSDRRSERPSHHSERQSDKHSNHSTRASDKQSKHSNHTDHPSSQAEHIPGVEQQPQQGFPQAYPEPTYPAAAYQQQPYQQPYPGDYPPTQPPV